MQNNQINLGLISIKQIFRKKGIFKQAIVMSIDLPRRKKILLQEIPTVHLVFSI